MPEEVLICSKLILNVKIFEGHTRKKIVEFILLFFV